MLEEQDFKKIGQVIEEKIEANNIKIGEEVGKVIKQNITPALDEIHEEIAEIKAEMVTKSYLDDKLADLEGSVIVRQRKEDKKLNLLIEFLRKKKVLEENEIKMLKDFQIFPDLSL